MGKLSLNIKIIISYYAARPKEPLLRLLTELRNFMPSIILIVNSDGPDQGLWQHNSLRIIKNANVGMNIGAWNRGFLAESDADFYLFLQDECYVRRRDFIETIVSRFRAEKDLGMLGETVNKKWNQPWSAIAKSPLNTMDPDHFIGDLPAKRVETYLNAMSIWGIEPGSTGTHLRSLVWAFPGNVMRELGGFPIGRNKGECIAAEIAVSRKILSLGYRFDQIAKKPFFLFGHSEWRDDGLSKIN
jgi:hypothetical protein